MKPFLFALIATVFICQHCYANLGDTVEAAKQKLGEPTHLFPVSGSNKFNLSWIESGLRTDYFFDEDGRTYTEEFVKTSDKENLSLDDARRILAAESNTNNWIEYHLGERGAWKNSANGSGALFEHSYFLIITNSRWVKRSDE